ncbi:MAG: hypothetical protein JW748_00665 [Anaerolineales bacterium]|nr:hypothetical protein [Anaerolineales bacterium]
MKLLFDFLNRIFGLGLLALGLSACVFFSHFGAKAIHNENQLRERGVVTDAEVTGIRPDAGDENDVGYDIQFQFVVEDGGTRYSYADVLNRRNLWYSPTQAEWSYIRETNRIRIVYLPGDPWVNRPLGRNPMMDSIAALAMGLMAGALCLMGAGVWVKRRLRWNYYRNRLRPETIDAIAHALKRIQSEGGGRNFVFFTLGKDPRYWIQCAGRPGARTLQATAADNRSLRKPFDLTGSQISRLRSLEWKRPSLRNPDHYHREWWAANDADRRRIACEIMQTFHEVYGLELDLPPVVHLGIADEPA